MNLNYTAICYYCGTIYKSCRSSSKYCCKNHNSLYFQNGCQINNNLKRKDGSYVDCYPALKRIYSVQDDESLWSIGYPIDVFYSRFLYMGPVPFGDELLLVSSFIIKKVEGFHESDLYHAKPFQYLTKHEKATSIIQYGSVDDTTWNGL